MRFRLLASTCLPALILAAPAHAETVIDAKRNDPVRTATIKAGAADDVRIAAAGSVTPTGGAAVTVDSANKLTNEGIIQVSNANGASGVLVTAPGGAGIVNTGKIIVDETYDPTDADKDGDLDGPFAVGSDRVGIRVTGAYAGPVSHSGAITVEGNDSAGIRLGGPLTGTFTHNGTTNVLGDRATGVQLGAVNGPVRLAGTISATGVGAIGARLDGDIAGALTVQGAIAATGYRTLPPPADATKLDGDDLLQGGTALLVAGNVSGGIVLAVPPKDASPTDADEDKDGIEDAKEGSATVSSYGAAPAMQIGATDRAITIGAVAGTGTGFGLIVDGSILGAGSYAGVEGTGLAIGGRGGAVTIAGGIGVNGKIEASSAGASATALRVNAGAATPEIRVAGLVSASGGGVAAAQSTAILLEGGSSIATIRNSGTIKATASANDGRATAILDRSGQLATIENSGTISASGALATSDRNVAIDVSARAAGVTLRQTAVAAGVAAPTIVGDVRFGSGADVFDIADGTVKGNASFGGGANRLTLSGDAAYAGNAAFGTGADAVALSATSTFDGTLDMGGGADSLALAGTARFTGSLANAQGTAVSVAGGTLEVRRTASIASLSLGSAGVLGVVLDKTGGTGTLIQVAGEASFAQGSKVAVRLATITDAEGRYLIVRAGSLNGAANLTATTTALPFLYKGVLSVSGTTDLNVDVTRKTVTELGLNRAQGAAYDAVYKALGADAKIGGAFLAINDGEAFRGTLNQMLPDHAGGVFEFVTQGSRAVARGLADPKGPFKDEGRWGWWLSSSALNTRKKADETSGYSISGVGFAGGAEYKTGLGNLGASVNYLNGRSNDRGTDNEVLGNQWEVAGYWRLYQDGFRANARVSAAHISFDGSRRFAGTTGTETISRIIEGDWSGRMVSANAGVAYDMVFGSFSLRPIAAIDYYRLREGGYTETGGGKALDLAVSRRVSDELAVTGSVAAGLDLGGWNQDAGWLRLEVEGGRRELVGGELGSTTAQFEGGQAFTIDPEQRKSGWVGKLRAVGGNALYRLGGELNAEQQPGRAVLALRVNLQIGL